MKNTSFFFTLVLGLLFPVLAKAQSVANKSLPFDESFAGYYENADGTAYGSFSLYDDENFGYLELTAEQKKNCAFVFGCQNSSDLEASGIAVKKGNDYASVVTEIAPALTFVFKYDGTTRSVEMSDKAGHKYLLNKVEVDMSGYYDEEYSDSEDAYQPYTDEEMEYDSGLDIRLFQRADGAELSVIFAMESPCAFMLHIPATKSCKEISIMSAFDEPWNQEGNYTYSEEEIGDFTMSVKHTGNSIQFTCVSGDCFDKKGKCGIWKEAFVQGD